MDSLSALYGPAQFPTALPQMQTGVSGQCSTTKNFTKRRAKRVERACFSRGETGSFAF